MRKILISVTFMLVTAFSLFAANPASDFSYVLSNDAESIAITGFKNNQKVYDIPATIEDIPVTAVVSEFVGFQGVDEILIKIPEGVKEFSLKQSHSRVAPFSHITIYKLPASIERCTIRVFPQRNRELPQSLYITVKGSLNELKNLISIDTGYVDFEEKKIIILSTWAKEWYLGAPKRYSFYHSTIQEVVFEEGCEIIGGFGWCSELKKVTLPASMKRFIGGFNSCNQLSEVVIPETLENENIVFEGSNQFYGTSISLKTQVRLRKLGYTDSFGN